MIHANRARRERLCPLEMKQHVRTLFAGGVLTLALLGAALAGPINESGHGVPGRSCARMTWRFVISGDAGATSPIRCDDLISILSESSHDVAMKPNVHCQGI
jgi:hypothetical protein